MNAILWQAVQIVLVVALAPLVTGYVRWLKSRLNGRRGAVPWQPYRDLYRLLQKEAIVAHSASWIFRAAPYVTFASVWLAACIVPTFTTNMALAPAADLIALVALLAVGRFWTALAGMDVGTSFGGLGASREMLIASLAELAMSEAAAMVRLTQYVALIATWFFPWGIAQPGAGVAGVGIGLAAFLCKTFVLTSALALFETSIAKMRVFRYADFLGGALLLGLLATIFLYVSEAV